MVFDNNSLRRLIIPLVIEQFLAVTVGMADSIMVASCGEAAVSGVALVDQISVLLIGVFMAMTSGGAVVAARYAGKKDKKMIGNASKQLFIAVGGISLLLTAAAVIFNRQILCFIYRNLEPDVMNAAVVYFLITALSYPFLGLYNGGAALFRAVGNSGISMKVSLAANIVNIFGNALLIYVFKMGVTGAAVSTLASRAVSCVIIIILLFKNSEISIRGKWSFDPRIMKKILYVGIPSGLENSIFQVGKLIVSSMIASLGTMAITANSINGSLGNIQNVPTNAIGAAMITVVGQCIGANDTDKARYYIRRLLLITYAATAVMCVSMTIAAEPLCGIYGLGPQTTELTADILRYNCICSMIVLPMAFTLPNALRAAGDVRYTMVIAIASMWIFRIVLAYILCYQAKTGLWGVWIAMSADWLCRAVCFAVRVKTGKWTKHIDAIS